MGRYGNMLAVCVFVVLSSSGCMEFRWNSGELRCSAQDECPEGYHCQTGYCYAGKARDAVEDDFSTDDDTEIVTDTDTGTGPAPDTHSDIDTDVDSGEDMDTEDDSSSKGATCTTVADCLPGGECATVHCDPGVGPGEFGTCRYELNVEQCTNEGECASGISCAFEGSNTGWVCKHGALDHRKCPGDGECGVGVCADNGEGAATCSVVGAAGKCNPGQCGVPACERIDARWTCTYSADPALCPASECGEALCNEALLCIYSSDDEACEGLGGQCAVGVCEARKLGEPPVCVFERDWYECESGDVCVEDPSGYACEQRACSDQDLGPETRIYEGEDGDSQGDQEDQGTPHPSYPSVANIKGGFAAVWMDTKNAGTYPELYLALFNDEGELRPASIRRPLPSTLGRHPRVVDVKTGFLLVYEGWVGRREIFLMAFANDGTPTMDSPLQISDQGDDEAFYPDAAFEKKSGQLGIVWNHLDVKDTKGSNIDVHGALYSVDTQSLSVLETPFISVSGSEQQPRITAKNGSFLVAAPGSDHAIYARSLDTNGVLAAGNPEQITPKGVATSPIAVAFDDTGKVAFTWRSLLNRSTMFMLRDPASKQGVSLNSAIPIGGALEVDTSSFGAYILDDYRGRHSLVWSEDSQLFVFAWDAASTSGYGYPNQAKVFLTRISGTDLSVQSPWTIGDGTHRAVQPSLAQGDDRVLVIWHDNRKVLESTSWEGDLYSAPLNCK